MAGNSFGTLFCITTWGESHGPAIGVVIDGCPAGLALDVEDIQRELDRRRPGLSPVASARREPDRARVLSGVFAGTTTGTPISIIIDNVDANSAAYETWSQAYRPGHADFSYERKFGARDWRGGGRASARETAGRVAAGAIAKKLLASHGVKIVAYVEQIGSIRMNRFDPDEIERNPVRCPDGEAAAAMLALIRQIQAAGDSIGSSVRLIISGVAAGLGEPVFDRLQAVLGHALFSIPAVKGIEFGEGFGAVAMKGSECNDAINPGNPNPVFASNHAGGSLGGISSGQDITARIAFKPPSSIAMPQATVTSAGESYTLNLQGRHDPVIGPRAVVVVEAMTALVLADFLLLRQTDRMAWVASSPRDEH